MGMIGYATETVLCKVAYATIWLFIWMQMNHNTTVREVKRLELQLMLRAKQLRDQSREN